MGLKRLKVEVAVFKAFCRVPSFDRRKGRRKEFKRYNTKRGEKNRVGEALMNCLIGNGNWDED